ncbi:MAG: hypothetical protein UW81_C0032G0005 [Candidatus Giovannonibacteria bacterium GW2011_GWC2_44_9]|uniref:Uncharacterized protein n=3 Tax=Parcubacteria group TaxID=1794811 RepID=A0A1F8GZC9_9BACT|nr:MAG: hypothetical protein UW14_C0012G0001 [Candidatus Yanofskybacteria bacterium GW2011_GWA2_44_10]KKT50204.1 MAG: hypothetical protein UW43_C0010G0001 [Candidatus Yanofskybacteria bacterium GW2011_GWA1_44_21]KKT82886.1 MAG: hypothetical protein UW81_C0032G0005 [Candidatus Giovannonibacteria bacterium GW2011_GWC2_44_9]KKT90335.1 MAG: hypothetical protein UW90_C0003G0059 [Candidatus Yanofskybacteria bacterium GW2011_GWB1_45_11]OGN14497.1 MAG: hypothetical protein A3C01_00205 [Candidatus Yanof
MEGKKISKNNGMTIDKLGEMVARNFRRMDKKLDKLDGIEKDIKFIKKTLIFGKHGERITALEKKMVRTQEILNFK